MNINSITVSGIKVDMIDTDEGGVWIDDKLVLTSDDVRAVLTALGLLGFDLDGYTTDETKQNR